MPRKPNASLPQASETEDFVVISAQAPPSVEIKEEYSIERETEKILEQAMKTYDLLQKQTSAFLTEKGTYTTPTLEELALLAEAPQDSLEKVLRINSIIAKYSNLDDVLGTVGDAIRTNLNTDYRLNYKQVDGRNKAKKLEQVKEIVESFNEDVSIRRVIKEQIPRGYMEGTVVMYLRKSDNTWTLDTYPLGVAFVSPYSLNGEPIIIIDMNELKSRLTKSSMKTRTGKNIFFDNLDSELKENFPDEVYKAFVNKEPYVKLDPRYTRVLRIGNGGRKYGISPAFKSIGASLILETFMKSDMLNAKARSKKFMYQLLDPVLLGPTGEKNPIPQARHAHKEFLEAYKQPSCLYTGTYVKQVGLIEPKGEMVGKDTILYYLRKQMSSLGISFLMSDANAGISSANISLQQLMRNINSISESLEDIFMHFYRQILIDAGLPPEYAPTIKIIDSEALETELKIKIATLLYSTLNCSLKTALETLGYDYPEEVNRRREENANGVDKDFYPRQTSYTSGGSPSENAPNNGRPPSEDENDKNQYDKEYNQNARPKK